MTPLSKIHIIFNSQKDRRKVDLYCDQVRRRWPDCELEITSTDDLDSGIQAARNACADGADLLVAAGGDGTLLSVVNAVIGENVLITILPLGTGNDYAEALKIYTVEDTVQSTCNGLARMTDAGQCRYVSRNGQHRELVFCSTAGVGLFGHVFGHEQSRVVQRLKHLIGDLVWPVLTLVSIFKNGSVRTEFRIEQQSFHREVVLCEFSKVPRAGGFLLAPNAKVDSGWLDCWFVNAVGNLAAIRLLLKACRNNAAHISDRSVEYISDNPLTNSFGASRLSHLEIVPERVMPVHLNGDPVGGTPAVFQVLPNALRILVPRL